MKKVLVTGASGLLAANSIRELLDSGYAVRALARDKSKFVLPPHANLELLAGDLTDPFFTEGAVSDCSCIVHAAAETRQGLSDYADYARVNVEATKLLYNAAVKKGVERIVHVSTSNVFGFGDLKSPGNESTHARRPFSDSFYVKSKIASQELALSYVRATEVVVVNPTFLIGPFDQKPGSGRIVLHGYNKRCVFYPPGGKNFVDVRDAARAIVAALEKGKSGQAYILCGENLSYREFFARLSMQSDRKPLMVRIPASLLLLAGLFGSALRRFGIQTEYTMTNMRILCVSNYYSDVKARRELGVMPGPIDNAISEAIRWFKASGRLR